MFSVFINSRKFAAWTSLISAALCFVGVFSDWLIWSVVPAVIAVYSAVLLFRKPQEADYIHLFHENEWSTDDIARTPQIIILASLHCAGKNPRIEFRPYGRYYRHEIDEYGSVTLFRDNAPFLRDPMTKVLFFVE